MVLCTKQRALWLFDEDKSLTPPENFQLRTLCEYFGVPLTRENAHDAFYDEPSVFFVSLHQWPHYPGTGPAEQTGAGAGVGCTLNVPLAAGTPAVEHRAHFEDAIAQALSRFEPDFVLVSAGFDAMAGDPLGDLRLEPSDLYDMTRHVMDVAAGGCNGRVVTLLEGGYHPNRLGEGVVAVIRALAGLDAP